MHNLNYTII